MTGIPVDPIGMFPGGVAESNRLEIRRATILQQQAAESGAQRRRFARVTDEPAEATTANQVVLQKDFLAVTGSPAGTLEVEATRDTDGGMRFYANAGRQQSEQFVEWFDDFMPGNTVWMSSTSGTGASFGHATDHVNATENAIGEVTIAAGTTASSRAACYLQPNGLIMGMAAFVLEWRGTVGAASTAADEFVTHWGFFDNPTAGAAPTYGVYFRYLRTTDGDFWACITQDGAGSTKTVTAVAPADYATLHIFRIEVNAAGTEAKFYRDGVLLATHTANIPDGAGERCGPAFRTYRTAYTATGRWSYLDWVYFSATRSNAR